MKEKFTLTPHFADSLPCKKCGESPCVCGAKTPPKILEKSAYKVKIRTKKVKDKVVTTIEPLFIEDGEGLLRNLKRTLGRGGSCEFVEDFVRLNLQGDCAARAKIELEKLGFRVC